RNVEGRRREAPVVLLKRNVTGFLFGTRNLVLLLDHNYREASRLGCMTENVPYVIVPKHARRAKMAAEGMVAEDVQFLAADFTRLTTGRRAAETRLEQRETQPTLECHPEIVVREIQTEALDRGGEEPVARMSHCASQQQVLRTRAAAGLQPGQN